MKEECGGYSLAGINTTTRHIKMRYFASHPALNTYGIIPEYNGPELE
jgi:glutathionyl-hydroquinone reductase